MPPLLVFTDLDGTLLDHDSYDWRPARPALGRLRAAGVPVVLASSKTAAEIAPLRDEIGLDAPAIVENGAGILDAEADPDRGAYARIRAALDTMPPAVRSGFRGFGDMGADEIARLTGLGPDAAARAADRAFSEPGLWTGTGNGRAAFMSTLADRGIAARQGGRFLTLSFGATKADRMAEIAHRYGDPPTVALGDAPNDAEMLEAADRGIVVANPHGAPLPPLAGEAEGRITRTDLPGPAGWNEAMLGVLNGMGL